MTDTEGIPLCAVPVSVACLLAQCTADISGCALYCLAAYAAVRVLLTIS